MKSSIRRFLKTLNLFPKSFLALPAELLKFMKRFDSLNQQVVSNEKNITPKKSAREKSYENTTSFVSVHSRPPKKRLGPSFIVCNLQSVFVSYIIVRFNCYERIKNHSPIFCPLRLNRFYRVFWSKDNSSQFQRELNRNARLRLSRSLYRASCSPALGSFSIIQSCLSSPNRCSLVACINVVAIDTCATWVLSTLFSCTYTVRGCLCFFF